jgi:hypothetical protein
MSWLEGSKDRNFCRSISRIGVGIGIPGLIDTAGKYGDIFDVTITV